MGPGRDLEDNASARIRNIETFEVLRLIVFDIIVIITIIIITMTIFLIEIISGNSSQILGEQRVPALQQTRHLPSVQQ